MPADAHSGARSKCPVPLNALADADYRERLTNVSRRLFGKPAHRLAISLVLRHQDGPISRKKLIELSRASASAMTRESDFFLYCNLVTVVKPEVEIFFEPQLKSRYWDWLDEVLESHAPWDIA